MTDESKVDKATAVNLAVGEVAGKRCARLQVGVDYVYLDAARCRKIAAALVMSAEALEKEKEPAS